jgi:Tol biopolymer transport system component
VFLVDLNGGKPRELTSGKQGATHSPVFNTQGDKVAWLELDEDGYESDRFHILYHFPDRPPLKTFGFVGRRLLSTT